MPGSAKSIGLSQQICSTHRRHETLKAFALEYVDTNKGDRVRPNNRSRVILCDIKARDEGVQLMEAEDPFSIMPPSEGFEH